MTMVLNDDSDPRRRRGARPANVVEEFEHMLSCAHKRMDELGYPPVNHPIYTNPTKENQT